MKIRMAKIAGVLLAGTLVLTVAYTASGNEAGSTRGLYAGVSSELDGGMADDQQEVNTKVASGVTDAVYTYLEERGSAEADVTETDAVTTASGQQAEGEPETAEAEKICGYTNLGVASVDGNLNVRKEPSTEADVVGKMPDDAGCEILSVEGEWTKIQSGKVEGYVKSEYLLSGAEAAARAEEVKQVIATVTTTTLFVREQPNTECSIVTMMPEGEDLEVIETLDNWVKINVDSDEGYVSADYVDISTQLAKAQTMTEVRYGQGVSDVRVSLVQYATQFVGNPYVWGGTSLTRGADCSGFVLSVFAKYGISLPHSSGAQSNCGRRISASEAQPGDLFFYGNGRQPYQSCRDLYRQRSGRACELSEVRNQDFRGILQNAGEGGQNY